VLIVCLNMASDHRTII